MPAVRTALLAALALAALALSACNVVTTKEPLFTQADASPHHLRDGVWAPKPDDEKCVFDETKPVEAWPECVDPVLVRNSELLAWQRDTKTWKADDTSKVLIVGGDPMILQFYDKPQDGDPIYLYSGVDPKLDADGRIVALQAWPVLCGPPPPPPEGQPASDDVTAAGTKAPFPGMLMDEKGQNCTTTDPGVVRAAAKASRPLIKKALTSVRWIRDGER
jgi:hypothetical protein